jgi:hypothetical protein
MMAAASKKKKEQQANSPAHSMLRVVLQLLH